MRKTEATAWTVGEPKRALMRGLRLSAVALGIGLVMTVGAARAGDDEEDDKTFEEKIIEGIMAGIGGTNMDNRGIDYRERSPLVVPPKMDLPPPAGTTADVKAPNWPKDPDEKRRKAALAARKKSVTNSTHELTPAEEEAARASVAASGQPQPQQSFTEKMNNYLGGTKPEVGQFKGEPTRETLTQPPPGYQIPSPNYAYGVGQKGSLNRDADNKDSKETSNKQ